MWVSGITDFRSRNGQCLPLTSGTHRNQGRKAVVPKLMAYARGESRGDEAGRKLRPDLRGHQDHPQKSKIYSKISTEAAADSQEENTEPQSLLPNNLWTEIQLREENKVTLKYLNLSKNSLAQLICLKMLEASNQYLGMWSLKLLRLDMRLAFSDEPVCDLGEGTCAKLQFFMELLHTSGMWLRALSMLKLNKLLGVIIIFFLLENFPS